MSEPKQEYKTKVKQLGIMELLDRPIAFHRCFVDLTGSVKAAVMLSQAVYWQPRAKQEDGWWYKTAEEWTDETGLSYDEQRTARKQCEKYLLSDLRGIPAQLYWKVDEEALRAALGFPHWPVTPTPQADNADLLGETPRTSSGESQELGNGKPQNINKNTETTSENTSYDDFSNLEKQPQPKPDLVDGYLAMANFPGAKNVARVDAILSYIGGRLQINTETKAWKEFAKKVDNAQRTEGQKIDVFFDWLLAQPKFELSYWPPSKMWEHWPRAFTAPAAPLREEGQSGGYYG